MAGSPLAGRPLVSLTFALNYAADGLNVRGYRLVNIALHVACALLLFAVASRQLDPDIAFAAALIWTVHPLNTEAVDYVSQRTAFFHLGVLIEQGPTDEIFTNPREQRTSDYITGRYG